MNLIKRYKVFDYNIGFLHISAKNLIEQRKIENIHWMQHSYRDRMFADPHLLNIENDVAEVLVEESEFLGPKAYLSKLSVSLNDFHLLSKQVIWKNNTHFSYPHIIRDRERIYILPENFESGKLNIYEYDKGTSLLKFVKCIIDEPLVDANIICVKDKYWLFASKIENSQSELYLWQSNDIFGPYLPDGGVKIKNGRRGSRMGGDIFEIRGKLYRVSQDCSVSYGFGLNIQRIEHLGLSDYVETEVLSIYPDKNSLYPDGLHTMTFHKDWCVIDGRYNRPDFFRGLIRRIGEKSGLYRFD